MFRLQQANVSLGSVLSGGPSAVGLAHAKLIGFPSGRGSAWLEHLVRDQGVGGSNPLAPINRFKEMARASARAIFAVGDFVGDGCLYDAPTGATAWRI